MIGFFARLLHAIPVKRAQDYAFNGSGTLSSDDTCRINGCNTKFTFEVHPGDTLKTSSFEIIVKSVESDFELTPVSGAVFPSTTYKIIPKLDQSQVYDVVQQELKRGRCIGIFPEGGSHDRTTPLPLKAGVCLMALGAMSRYNITVTIQCIGLNYYEGHRFRSKAVMNFGVPYTIPRELATLFSQDRKKAIHILLEQIESVFSTQRLKEVWVTAPSFEELSQVFMARRLYEPEEIRENPALIMEMNLKFSKGYRYIKERYPHCEELATAVRLVEEYSRSLKLFGLQDHQAGLSKFPRGRLVVYTVLTVVRILVSLALVRDR